MVASGWSASRPKMERIMPKQTREEWLKLTPREQVIHREMRVASPTTR